MIECVSLLGQIRPGSVPCEQARSKHGLPPLPVGTAYKNKPLWEFEICLKNRDRISQICRECPVFAEAFPKIAAVLNASNNQ
jgi:hypothetical protein